MDRGVGGGTWMRTWAARTRDVDVGVERGHGCGEVRAFSGMAAEELRARSRDGSFGVVVDA